MRCRPDWLDWRRRDRGRIASAAEDQGLWRSLWTESRRDPTERPAAYQRFAHDLRRRKAKAQEIQAALKRRIDHVGGDWSQVRFVGNKGLNLDQLVVGMSPMERFWRYSAYGTWHTVLADRPDGAHDRREWSHPPLAASPVDESDYARFWLHDVDGDRVPIQRIIGLTEHFQLTRRIGEGNLLDLHHAVHLLDADLFLTADRRLYDALCSVVAQRRARGQLVFVDRSAASGDALATLIQTLAEAAGVSAA